MVNPTLKGVIFGGLCVLSLGHPHLREKWQWLFEVLRGQVGFAQRFRGIDVFDFFLHTGMTLAFLVLAIQAFRSVVE